MTPLSAFCSLLYKVVKDIYTTRLITLQCHGFKKLYRIGNHFYTLNERITNVIELLKNIFMCI